jgi:hypothetical protein
MKLSIVAAMLPTTAMPTVDLKLQRQATKLRAQKKKLRAQAST